MDCDSFVAFLFLYPWGHLACEKRAQSRFLNYSRRRFDYALVRARTIGAGRTGRGGDCHEFMGLVDVEKESEMIYRGDCLDVLPKLEAERFDSCVCDPPYELNFMGRSWDGTGIAFKRETWEAVYRVLKPGAHLLAFGGCRTYHRMVCAIEDAGFEIRDSIHYTFGSGFPKSQNIGKMLDRMAGMEREVVGKKGGRALTPVSDMRGGRMYAGGTEGRRIDLSEITAPASPEAKKWDGYGTALKPSHEIICVARKPLNSFTAEQVHAMTGWKRLFSYNGKWSWRAGGEVPRLIKDGLYAEFAEISEAERAAIKKKRVKPWKKSDVYEACMKHGLEWWESGEGEDLERWIYRRSWHPLVPSAKGKHVLIGKNKRVVLKRWAYKNRLFHSVPLNVLKHGTGAINITKGRIGSEKVGWGGNPSLGYSGRLDTDKSGAPRPAKGRWPANAVFEHAEGCRVVGKRKEQTVVGTRGGKQTEKAWSGGWSKDGTVDPPSKPVTFEREVFDCVDGCPVKELDRQSGVSQSSPFRKGGQVKYGGNSMNKSVTRDTPRVCPSDSGGASRFFFCAKTSSRERNAGLEGMPDIAIHGHYAQDAWSRENFGNTPDNKRKPIKNNHPTVKPLKLLSYLIGIYTPSGGRILDPFMGSGSTGCAAARDGFDFVGIEKEKEYYEIAELRIKHWSRQRKLFS